MNNVHPMNQQQQRQAPAAAPAGNPVVAWVKNHKGVLALVLVGVVALTVWAKYESAGEEAGE